MSLKPECIGAKVDLVWPIEAASPLANGDAREKFGISEGGKNALANQMIEMMHGLRAVCTGEPDGARVQLGFGADDDVLHL